jgi:hypothetical protein
LNDEFIINSAIKLNLTTSEKLQEIDSSKVTAKICELEKQLLYLDNKHLLNLAKTKIPNGAVSEPKATPLTREPLFSSIEVGGK